MWSHKAGALVLALRLAVAAGGEQLTLTESDDGRTVETTVGSVLTIRLPSAPGSGYSWLVEHIDKRRAKELGSSEFEPTGKRERALGGPAHQVFRFAARQAGRSKLVLHYRRPWEKKVPPLRTFTLNLDAQ